MLVSLRCKLTWINEVGQRGGTLQACIRCLKFSQAAQMTFSAAADGNV